MSRHQNGVGVGYPVVPTSYEVAHVVTLLVFTFLATVAVALRFWARRIPPSGDLRVKCLGTHHQKSIYLVWPPNAPFNKQYDYISLFHIAYSHIYLLGSAEAVFFRLYLIF